MGETLDRRQALRMTAVVGVGGALSGSLVAALLRDARVHRVAQTRTRMGTVVTITVLHPDADDARGIVDRAFTELERLEALLSRHRPDTPVARLNRTGALRTAPPELLEVLGRASTYAALTEGAFDVTVAPLLDLYEARFAPSDARPPSPAEVSRALSLVDHRAIRVDGAAVTFDRPGMSITLDGIAKGYIVDRTAEVLAAAGAERVLVNAGGDMASSEGGARDPWTIAIQDPRDASGVVEVLRLGGECVATSGDYMNTFTEDRRHHHIVDPRTGYSPGDASSVTVVAQTAMDADALSTAALVLGPERGLALLEALRGVEGMIVGKSPTERRATSGLRRLKV